MTKVKYIKKLLDVSSNNKYENPLILNNVYIKLISTNHEDGEYIVLKEYPHLEFQASAFVIVEDINGGERAPIVNDKPSTEKGIKPQGERQFN